MKTPNLWVGIRLSSMLKSCKKSIPKLLTISSLLLLNGTVSGQDSLVLGSVNSFKKDLFKMSSPSNKGNTETNSIKTNEGELPLKVNFNKVDYDGSDVTIGEIEGSEASTAYFSIKENKLEGEVILQEKHLVYKYATDANGKVYVKKVDIHDVICSDYEKLEEESANQTRNAESIPPPSSEAYKLQSFPQSPFVLYLDFDGEVVSRTRWAGGATINAQPMDLSASQIEEIWKLISEDFRPFNVNVTTDRAVYNATPRTRRQMQIFTTTKTAAPSAGGVAYLRSFGRNSDDSPCWTYNRGIRGAGETGSHEFGHTLGLNHDGIVNGTAYYRGTNLWSTIMGWSASSSIGHWSAGEYQNANNRENDLATIAGSRNGFGYRSDEVGNTLQSAKTLITESNGNVLGSKNNSVIITRNDIDIYRFNTSGGNITLNVNPSESNPNLDVLITLYNEAGATITSSNPTSSLNASLSQNLSSGTYYLSVEGTGRGNPLNTGYSDYSSLGEYFVSGNIPNQSISCATPSNINISNISNSGANLSWSSVSGANTYQAWWRPVGGEWTNTSVTGTSIQVSNLNADTDYEFTVRANCSGTNSDFASPYFSFKTLQNVAECLVPSNLNVSNISETSAVLNWSNQSEATSYQVFWRVTNGNWENRTVTTSNTTINNLTANTEYEFTVRANCSGDFTAFTSPWVRFTTQQTSVCETPSNLTSNDITQSSARLAWQAQSGVTNYQVWWRTGSGNWSNQTVTSNFVNLTGLQAGANYEFTVRANCNGNFTDYASPRGNFTTLQDVIGDKCDDLPTYTENNGYVAGSRVKNAGGEYECKPFPFSGWCNGASWAYGPGTGAHWQDAWNLVGSCTESEVASSGLAQSGDGVIIMPNPFVNQTTIFLENGMDITGVRIVDAFGKTVFNTTVNPTDKFDLSNETQNLSSGIYIVYIISNDKVYSGKMIKQN